MYAVRLWNKETLLMIEFLDRADDGEQRQMRRGYIIYSQK